MICAIVAVIRSMTSCSFLKYSFSWPVIGISEEDMAVNLASKHDAFSEKKQLSVFDGRRSNLSQLQRLRKDGASI